MRKRPFACMCLALSVLLSMLLALSPLFPAALALAEEVATEEEAEVSLLQVQASKPTLVVTRVATGKLGMKKGSSYKLAAKASKGAKVTYKSGKPSVVAVTKKGVLKARNTGKATITITAKSGKAKATKKVKVTVVAASKYKKVKAIAVSPAKKTLSVDGSFKIKTTLAPSKASNKNLLFKSSNTKVATVSAAGKVTAVSAGTAKITVTSADNSRAKKVVTVTVAAKAADTSTTQKVAVSAKASRTALEVGDIGQVTATVSPASTTNKRVTYASSNTSVLTVDATGKVTAVAPGFATVRATSVANASAVGKVDFTVKPQVTAPAPDPATADGVEAAAYDEEATTVDLAYAAVSEDGTSAMVNAGVFEQAPAAGQVVVIADNDLQGTAIKVTSANRKADGSYDIHGTQPAFEEVFDELNVAREQTFDADDLTWVDPDVEYLGVGDEGISTQAEGTIGGNSFKFKLSHDFWEKKGFGDKLAGNVSWEVQASVKPSVDWALDFNGLSITRLKVMPELDAKISGAIAAGITLKIPLATFDVAGTGVTLNLVVGVDGNFSLSYDVDVAAGIDWKKGKSGFFNYDASAEGSHEFSASGKLGLDAQAKVGLLCFEIGSFDVEAGGTAEGTLAKRTDDLRCSDVTAWVYAQASYNVEDFIARLGGIDAKFTKEIWNKSTSLLKTPTWHFENGQRVSECTWENGTSTSVTVRSSLAAYSWDELKSIANAIAAASTDAKGLAVAKRYNLVGADGKLKGDTKEAEVDGLGTAQIRIAGFRHDEKADGTGVAGITFEFANIVDAAVMNDTYWKAGGWQDSLMRSYLNDEFLGLLPASLSNNVVEVRKATNNVGKTSDSSSVTTTDDKLWLLSMREVYGEMVDGGSNVPAYPNVYNAEGDQYKLYADNNVSVTNFSFAAKPGIGSSWWLRSPDAHYLPDADYLNDFHFVDGSGGWCYYGPDDCYGVAPGFCF